MKERMKILFIHHGNVKGGAFLSLLYLLRALDQSLYEPIVCNGGDEQDPQVEAIFFEEGFSTCSCRLPRFAHTTGGSYSLYTRRGWNSMLSWFQGYRKSCRSFAELINNMKPDMVHFNSLTLAPYARVSSEMGIPTIVHVREVVLDGVFGIRKNFLRRHLIKDASKVIAICQDNFDRLSLPVGKGVVIYNPVDLHKFDYVIDGNESRKKLDIPDSTPVILFAGGSVWDVKGLFEFLQAMQQVKKKLPTLICLMPGFPMPYDPAQREWTFRRRIAHILGMFRKSDQLFRLFKSNGLDAQIVRSDFVYDIENWLAACDVVCVPHMQPHFSRTVMEAGAMKKPVVGFAIGGVSEVVQEGVTGLLVQRANVSALADVATKLLEDAGLASKLGQGGYQQAIGKFSAEHSASQVETIYKELIRECKLR